MNTSIVLGLLFGDEGKGSITSFLTKNYKSLVIRFNGGHQAGHTVVENGYRHIFSSLGAGTLNGADTYISEYCTFYPYAFKQEINSLILNGFNPTVFVNPLTMITTPFDVFFNQKLEDVNKHGSVGVGFGATIARNEETPYKLYAVDLFNESILKHKLKNISNYYKFENSDNIITEFMKDISDITSLLSITTLSDIKNNYEQIVFEGAQGILLDMNFGYFPNVTRSNTTSKNALQIIKDNNLPIPNIIYCMRSYLTRHGNGPMINERRDFNFEDLTNKSHKYQGDFRQGEHSLNQIKYAISCDSSYSGFSLSNKMLFISCLDQTDNKILIDGKKLEIGDLKKELGINIYVNNSVNTKTIKIYD